MPDYLSDFLRSLREQPSSSMQRAEKVRFGTPSIEDAIETQSARDRYEIIRKMRAEQERLEGGGLPESPETPYMFRGERAPLPPSWQEIEDLNNRKRISGVGPSFGLIQKQFY